MNELPKTIPVFPLARALLLPGGSLPLVIFENRYLAMLKEALAGERVLGMIQPKNTAEIPELYDVGCLGRITSFNEIEGERMLITLTGLSRFSLVREIKTENPFRTIEVDYQKFLDDLELEKNEDEIAREKMLGVVKRYLNQNNLQADWGAIKKTTSSSLVTAFSILSPYGILEKQALLEAKNSAERCELLIALTEMILAQGETVDELNENSSNQTSQPTLQ